MHPSNQRNNNKGLDQYFTSDQLADQLVNLAAKYVGSNTHFVEPSAGTGQIIKALHRAGYNRNITGIEIDPVLAKTNNFVCTDFLRWKPVTDSKPIIVIGNPPFAVKGKRYAVARFINHSLEFGENCIFIVPLSMTSARNINRIELHNHLVENILFDPPKQEFITSTGKTKWIKVAIQVWQKRSTPRISYNFLLTSEDFGMPFATKHLFQAYEGKPDILVRRDGCLKDVGQLIFAEYIDSKKFYKELERLRQDKGNGLCDFYILVKQPKSIRHVVQKIRKKQEDFYKYLENSSSGNMYSLSTKEFISIYTNGAESYLIPVTNIIKMY